MFTVYALHSKSFNKIYVGFTSDLEARLDHHNKFGTHGYTKKFRPWTLVHTEEFETKSEAIRRERELKSHKGRDFLWQLIREGFEVSPASAGS